MKKHLLFATLILIKIQSLNSQTLDPFEVEIRNTTANYVYVRISPVGAIFNGDNSAGGIGRYSTKAAHPNIVAGISNIDGGIKRLETDIEHRSLFLNHDLLGFNFDESRPLNMSIGWGKYKIEFGTIEYVDSIYKEWIPLPGDSYGYIDFNDGGIGYSPYFLNIDINVFLKFNTIRNYYITFKFAVGSAQEVDITDNRLENRTIKMWHQVGTFQNNQWDPIFFGSPQKGAYYSDTLSSNEEFPINATRIISIGGDQIPLIHETSGLFSNAILNVNYNSLVQSDKILSFNNADFIVKNNITFNFLSNSNFQFDTSSSSFQTSIGSNIYFPQNYSLSISNGAKLISKGTVFTSTSTWNGIKLENSGSDTILNCIFNNAKTSISIVDDNLGNHPNKIIRKNIFNINQTSGRGIDIRNQNKILIDSNTFNFSNSNSTIGIFFRNSDPPGSASQNNFFYYSLNIVNNKFNYGYLPIYISNLTSSRPPFYIYKNSFIGNNIYSIGGSKISGDIKNNKFDVNNINRAIGLWNSNPNIYGNDIGSTSANMYLNLSFPTVNPFVNTNNQLVWTGGRNIFNSLFNENIYLDGSYPYIDNGKNLFSVDETNHHLFGRMPDTVNSYRMTYNCWNGHNDLPSYFLYKLPNDTLHQIYDVIYTPTYCDATINSVSNIITDRGDGIYDTVLVSNTISSDPISDDEILLNQARASNDSKDYADAVTNYKGLIDDFAESEYVYTSLYEMYDNYSALDTSDDQTVTDVLFSDLKQYLQNKISSDDYDKDFNSIAYEIILMCETQMKNYEAALTGYEFIALYHPNADQRMLASWDYEEIEGLINGEGGGEKQLQITNYELQIEEFELSQIKRLNKLINDDPLLSTLKKNYDKVNSNEKYKRSDKIADDKIILRAKENIFVTKFLQKEEKENRFIDDLKLLMSKGNTNSNSEESKISEPQEYKLNQNYPNPFNPTTNITFEIPSGSQVTLKVFDVTGKEITTLVNEFKQKGSYKVTFNGLNLSSGIYYFKISAGEWSQV